MPILYVSLDNVLADFDAGAEQVLGRKPKEFIELHGEKEFWHRLKLAEGFFASLGWAKGGKTLWGGISSRVPSPRILTTLPPGAWGEADKRAWVQRELGGSVPVIVATETTLKDFCSAGDVLISARKKRELDWATVGGEFVRHRGNAVGTLNELKRIDQGRPRPPRPSPNSGNASVGADD
ncbi:MAG TPA: hypothetical protein VGR19_11860 [Allosphingosinicella sp.]|nr:hypothetical protein [Allosphingosinicella sp.]